MGKVGFLSTVFVLFSVTLLALPPNDKVWDIALSPRYVWMACSNAEGRAGYTTTGVLRRYDRKNREWRTFTMTDIFGEDFDCEVTAVATHGYYTIWVGIQQKVGDVLNYACAVSHDNGDTWESFSEADGISVNSVYCVAVDPVTETVWLGHAWGESYYSLSRSTDGGETWTQLDPNWAHGVSCIAAYDNLVWVGADEGASMVVFKSTDNGQNWTNYEYDDSTALYGDPCDLCMVSPDEVHVVTYNYFSLYDQTAGYCYTKDGGATWHTHQVIQYDEYARTVTVDNGTVWVGMRWHDPQVLFRSTDYGGHWEPHNKSNGLPYDNPFVIRYDKYADIVWAGFWSDTFTNFQGGWCWTDDDGATWHTDNPPALDIPPEEPRTAARSSGWSLYD